VSELFSAGDLAEASKLVSRVFEAFADEQDGAPTFGEFLEILGWSVPDNNEFMGASPIPLVFKAKVKGNKRYKAEPSDRVAGLNDNTFNEATDVLAFLVERAGSARGQEVSPADLAGHVLQVLRAGDVSFADISSGDVVDLTVDVPKRIPKPKVGDVVAIPAAEPGYHLAVVLADDQIGLALGLLQGVVAKPRVGRADQYQARHIPIYTDARSIANGTWRIVGHNDELLALFPDPPELYWDAVTAFGDRFGDYGAAGRQDSPKRLISKEEAEAVGVLDGTYRQTHLGEYFQKALNEGRFDNGPVPGTFPR
jgi:hypothetical protein